MIFFLVPGVSRRGSRGRVHGEGDEGHSDQDVNWHRDVETGQCKGRSSPFSPSPQERRGMQSGRHPSQGKGGQRF